MSKKTDGNVYTVVFAVGMVLVVGALLAFLASESALKPFITENKRIEKQQNILYAMGVNENQGTSAILFQQTLLGQNSKNSYKKQLVIEGNKTSEDDQALFD